MKNLPLEDDEFDFLVQLMHSDLAVTIRTVPTIARLREKVLALMPEKPAPAPAPAE